MQNHDLQDPALQKPFQTKYNKLDKGITVKRLRLNKITKHICTQNYVYILTIQTVRVGSKTTFDLKNTTFACGEYISIRPF